ncbi:hypothetical protein [Thiolapillus sp.]|uniref:hypothetical protein n=2 Tax=Thiolapillus sp. TaxID=2017437 RepID=UPI0025D43699|nr:hypothetical protein [Thiolapillus sp.]
MKYLYPVMQEYVTDPDQNIGQFPFFVQHGEQEILLVLHENGTIDLLEEGYELPNGSFSQDVDGLIAVHAPEPLAACASCRYCQVLNGTQ